ncbi:glucosaminidase domain-containing protein [candidate division KSB1 bacterium]
MEKKRDKKGYKKMSRQKIKAEQNKIILSFLLALVLIILMSAPVYTADPPAGDATDSAKDQTNNQIKPSVDQPKGFRFIVLSDTNPSFDKEVLNTRFPKALAGIPQHNPVFVLHAGDMIGGGGGSKGTGHIDSMWSPFFGAIKAVTAANIPYLPTPGNHDKGYRNDELKEGYKRNWMKNYPNPPFNPKGNYPFYYSFDFVNNHFIMLDSSNIKLRSDQLQWLAQDLANAKNKDNTFVILHVPFMSSGMGHSEHAETSALELIANAGVKYIFAGHNHVYKEHTHGNTKQITVGTAADDLRGGTRDRMFLVVDVLGKDNVKMYPAGSKSGFKNTLDGTPIPSAPTGAVASFNPNSLMGTDCTPGTGDISSLISGEGISYSKTPFAKGFFHEVAIDPNKYDVKFVSAKKATGKSKTTLAEIVRNTPGAVAGINGGFFEGGGKPTHSVVEDGVLTRGSNTGSYAFVVENGRYKIISSSDFNSYDADKIKNSVSSALNAFKLAFNGVNNACSEGGCNTPAPRSGVCITKDGIIKLIAVHGIPKGSVMKGGAASIKKFAQEAINNHGCFNGINLDGGGSTSLEFHVNGQDVSLKGERNSGGCKGRGFPCQRSVANALVVIPKQSVNPPAMQLPGAPPRIVSPTTTPIGTTPVGAVTAIDSITGAFTGKFSITGMVSANCPDFSAITNEKKKTFFEQYWPHAVKASNGAVELAKFTLAQAALESGWGKSGLTKDANNFFGVKGSGDAGSITKRTREVYGGRETYVNAKFAKYSSPAESFKAHNKLLEKSRYTKKRQQLFGTSDMTKLSADQILEATWKAGYATDPKYIQLVKPIIRDMEKAVSCLGTTAPITPQSSTPTQQIGCVCEPATQNTIVSVPASQPTSQTPAASTTSSAIAILGAATTQSKPNLAQTGTSKGYDFSAIDSKYKGFGAKKDFSKISKFDGAIKEASQKFNVPTEFIKGIIMVESDGKTLPSSTSEGGKECQGDKCLCNTHGYCGLMKIGPFDTKCSPLYNCNWENFKKGDEGAKDQIFSGTNHIKKLMTSYDLGPKDSPDYLYWVAVGYKGTPNSANYIREVAAARLGKSPEKVRWNDVTIEDARKNQQKYFPSIPGKTEEIFYYASKVMSVMQAAGGTMHQQIHQIQTQQCSYGYEYEYASLGKYTINPSFTAEIDYDITDYERITGIIKNIISKCKNKNLAMRRCIEENIKDDKDLGGGLTIYNGPCNYAENMFSDFVEWTAACLKSKDTNCSCRIPLEYEYEKKDTDEEVAISASGSGNLRISSSNPGIDPIIISGSLSGSKVINTKSSEEVYYAKKSGTTLTFKEKKEGDECSVEKVASKFCVKTKNTYMVYDEKKGKAILKPIEYKFAIAYGNIPSYTVEVAPTPLQLRSTPGAYSPTQIKGGVAAGECHYCNTVREEIKKWSEEDYQKCKSQKGMCCKVACPPGTKIVPNVPYYHQCSSELISRTRGCQPGGRSSCSSGCGPTSFKMGLEAFGIKMDIKNLFCPGTDSVYKPGGGQPSWMQRVARKLGLSESKHIEGGVKTDEKFKEMVRNIVSGKPTPISITEQGRKLNMERCRKTAGHYVLGIGGNDDYLIINDPYAGKACPRSVGEHLVLTREHVKTATAGKRIVYLGGGTPNTAAT